MRPVVKVAIVAGGYLFAALMAFAAVYLHAALASETGPQTSGGMSAFGDLVLFVGVFGMIALVPTGVAIFFLFPKKKPTPSPDSTLEPVTRTSEEDARHP